MTLQTLGRGLPRGGISESTEYFHELAGVAKQPERKDLDILSSSWFLIDSLHSLHRSHEFNHQMYNK